MYGYQERARRLPSRKSFACVNGLGTVSPKTFRCNQWLGSYDYQNDAVPEPSESLPLGTDLPRRDWVALNRARSKVAKTKDNLVKWGFTADASCECGADVQTLDHILRHCQAGPRCSDEDLREANDTARRWLHKWRDKL